MSKELVEQAVEAAADLDELSAREFGAPIAAREVVVSTVDDEGLQVLRGHEACPQGDIVPLGANFSTLTNKINRGFGLLTAENGVRRLYPAVITSRTTSRSLHITYLRDHIVLPDVPEQNINDTGEDTTLSAVQKQLLSGARGIQDRSVGTEHSHNTVAKSVTEIGHTAMVLRALSDSDTMEMIKQGKHIVHDWSDTRAGIATKLTQRDGGMRGAFDMKTENSGERRVSLPSIELTRESTGVMLVSHSAFDLPERVDTKFVIGLGLVAAQQQFGSERALADAMLTTMDRVQ